MVRRHVTLVGVVLAALLLATAAADAPAATECVGDTCPVPEEFAGASPPAPDFAVRDAEDNSGGGGAAAAAEPDDAELAEFDALTSNGASPGAYTPTLQRELAAALSTPTRPG